jgi:hypothetical protein
MPLVPHPESLASIVADLKRRLRLVETDPRRGAVFLVDATTAPADASLSAGQAALWLDPTVGASKLMVKAKDTAGTVVTGSVTLT